MQSKTALYPWGQSSRLPSSLSVNHGIFIFYHDQCFEAVSTLFFLHTAVCVCGGILFWEPTFVCHMYLILSTVQFSLQQIFIVAIFCLNKWVRYYDMIICNIFS